MGHDKQNIDELFEEEASPDEGMSFYSVFLAELGQFLTKLGPLLSKLGPLLSKLGPFFVVFRNSYTESIR